MFSIRGFGSVQKNVLLTFLMTLPLVIHAQVADDVETASVDSADNKARVYILPKWPERRHQPDREALPPPPPGPYMSSALSGYSAIAPSFSSNNRNPAKNSAYSNLPPIKAFSPDVPWPSNVSSPRRWKPENGYNYVKPLNKKVPYAVRPLNVPSNYFGYQRGPVTGGPSSVRRPSTGVSSDRYRDRFARRPYAATPNVDPRNNDYWRSNSNSAYPPNYSTGR